MNVVYASNEKYVKHMAASMASLFEKNKNERRIVAYVVSIGITEGSKALLEEMAGRYGRTVCWLEMEDIRGQFDFDVDTRGFDISAMGRLFVGRLLPETVRRVLYLDCDTVVARPLGRLWRTSLQDKTLGAVMEPTIYKAVKQGIGLGREDAYVNSGVLLIDLKKWRERDVEKRLLGFYKEKGGSLFACDQDTINGALKDEIFYLPPEYNFFTNYRYFSYRELVRQSGTYRAVGKEEFCRAKRHPAVIHYAGDERPWIAGNRNHYRKAYEAAAALTPWAGEPKEAGREWYMLAYHLMDYVTVICPFARRMVSRYFGMKVVEARRGAPGEGSRECTGQERIQVLLAAFNGERYIGEQLDSVLAQTVPGIEILVSDDGSADATREILEQYRQAYPGRVLIRHRAKEGEYQSRPGQVPEPAMNFFWLLSQAGGDYVLLSDQDDVWRPDKVEVLLKRMKEIERPGRPALVFSDMEVVDAGLRQISPSFFAYGRSSPGRMAFSEILAENPVTGGALMMNRALAEMAKDVPQACFMHDWWIALTASCFGEVSCVQEPLSLYRQHGGNTLGARNTGSLGDLKERALRGSQVRENYRRMFRQARAFGRMYGKRLEDSQREALLAFLSLPGKTPAGRFACIVKNRFYKSSWLQTLAQCVTIPKAGK